MKQYSSQDLIGYLLGALEPNEEKDVERALASSEPLRERLADLEDEMRTLPDRFVEIDPPSGLTEKTLNTIGIVDTSLNGIEIENVASGGTGNPFAEETDVESKRDHTLSPQPEPLKSRSPWSMMDLIVGSAVCLVIAAILFPSIANSKFQSDVTVCQDNLRQVGQKLAGVADGFGGKLDLGLVGNRFEVSQYVEKLMHAEMLSDINALVCPGDPRRDDTARICRTAWGMDKESAFAQLQEQGSPELLTPELMPTTESKISQAVVASENTNPFVYAKAACGSYGFSVPQIESEKSRWVSISIPSNSSEVISADAGCFDNADMRSQNHSAKGQNVLYGDLSVGFIRDSSYLPTGDHLYKNDQGEVQPGRVPGDNLIFQGPMYLENSGYLGKTGYSRPAQQSGVSLN